MQAYSAQFCNKIETIIRNNRGIRITSGCRSWAHNQQVGGAQYSQHLYGMAVDLAVIPGYPNMNLDKIVKIARQWGLTPIKYGTHVHVQMFNGLQFKQLIGAAA